MDNNKKLKVLSLFSGIGAFEKGLVDADINYEIVGFSEIDKYAIEAYSEIHNVDKIYNLGDISKVDDLGKFKGEVDLVVGGSPCQDFSIAGKQQGSTFECLDCKHEFNPLIVHYSKRDICPKCNSANLEKTRSSLLIEYLRTIREIKPKYFIYENVKNIVGKKFKDAFDMFEVELQEYGYNTYWEVLNAKNYGIPQNRERVFVIGIRKDIDDGKFEFPEGFDSGLRLKDFLLSEVEDKYYIDNDRADVLTGRIKGGIKGHYPNVEKEPLSSSALSSREHRAAGWSEGIGTLCARDYKDPKVIAEPIVCEQRTDEGLRFFKDNICGTIRTIDSGGDKRIIEVSNEPNELKLFTNLAGGKWDKIHESARRVYDESGIAPTIPTCGGGNIEPKVAVKMCAMRGRYNENGEIEQQLEIQKDEISNSLTTVQKDSMVLEPAILSSRRTEYGKSIRKKYESGEIKESRHNMTELYPRGDGISNTLTTVQKDNLLLEYDYRIRKLTPLECFRLMGFADGDYWKARYALEKEFYNGKDRSNSQMYKMAGNSICVNVLETIFKNLFKDYIHN